MLAPVLFVYFNSTHVLHRTFALFQFFAAYRTAAHTYRKRAAKQLLSHNRTAQHPRHILFHFEWVRNFVMFPFTYTVCVCVHIRIKIRMRYYVRFAANNSLICHIAMRCSADRNPPRSVFICVYMYVFVLYTQNTRDDIWFYLTHGVCV